MENDQDVPVVLETPEEPVEEQTVEETPEAPQTDEEKEQLKAKVAELESKNKQLYERAKKQKEVAKEDGLSNKDVLFLAKADIHQDDLDEVLDWAKFKKVPVNEAYKQLKDTLDVRAEQRKTAAATQTRGSARGASKVSGEDLLTKAERTNEVPDTDEGMAELFKARLARRFPTRN